MILSIITPTLGNKTHLQRLFQSLNAQDFQQPVEIILSTTGINTQELVAGLDALKSNYKVTVLSSSLNGIAIARNRGLHAARGTFVLFLDDDCSLPRSTYLEEALAQMHTTTHKALAGAYVVSDRRLNFSSAFYNHMSNLWLKSFSSNESLQVVLGGCALFHRETLLSSGAHFEENEDKAAEEYAFTQKAIAQNITVTFCETMNVHHNPGCNLKTLLRKSWNHGRAMNAYSKTPHQRRWPSYFADLQTQPLQNLRFLPLLILFLGVGRASYFYRKSSDTVKSIHKPFPKRS